MRPLDVPSLNFEGLIGREWLVANGCGGYASSTICGLNTRKYHGLLVAAMAPPVRRMVLLSHLDETVIASGHSHPLSSNEYPGAISPLGYQSLRAFNCEPFPRWGYQSHNFTLEKSLQLIDGESTVCLTYSLLAGDKPVELEIRPLLAMRSIHELTYQSNGPARGETLRQGLVRVPPTARAPELFFGHDGQFSADAYWYLNTIYRRETERGYGGLEDLWNPGLFRWTLQPGMTAHLVCSTEPVNLQSVCRELDCRRETYAGKARQRNISHDAALHGLLDAASAFIVRGAPRTETSVSVIPLYPWGAPDTRSAMIAFPGLFLVPLRWQMGKQLLLARAAKMRNGVIPTFFSETGGEPSYDGADTSLWFIDAAGQYLETTHDEVAARALLPSMVEIIRAYRAGTDLGIRCDAEGLIGAWDGGLETWWMDAGEHESITPRRGQTVEFNALWYNALRVTAAFKARLGESEDVSELTALASRVKTAFNQRFWNESAGCCFDVISDNGVDASFRPNQILAMSLPYPVLAPERHDSALAKIVAELLTPRGVRTLSRRDTAYHGRYGGDVGAREHAKHQGSAYPWLLGPLARAYVRVNGRGPASLTTVRGWLSSVLDYLLGDGMGQICELFDGDDPQSPGGAIASAMSVGCVLQCYVQDVLGEPTLPRPEQKPDPDPQPGAPVRQ